MRTTIDLPDDLHRLARHLAHESGRSMSDVVADLIRAGLGGSREGEPVTSAGARGLPVVALGRPVTTADVRSLDGES